VLTRLVFFISLILAIFIVVASAQSSTLEIPIHFTIVPLTVEKGLPLQVTLTDKVRFKIGEPVHGKIVEPVYAFDREVIPVGAEVIGKITGFKSGGTWKRVTSLLAADFTPVRTPLINFDTIVLENGTRIPISTTVEAGTDTLVRYNGGLKQAKDIKPTVELKNQTKALVSTSSTHGDDLLKGMLWNLAPYHPQSLPTGIRYKATLMEPLDFGTAILGAGAFDKLGSAPPSGTTVFARLETALDSRTAKQGAIVKAVLTRPVFSRDRLLIFPVGSRLVGEVVQAHPAGAFHHGGQLSFKFTRIEPPASILLGTAPPQELDGSLSAVLINHDLAQLRINELGDIRVAESKTRFFAPALAMVGVAQGFNFGAEPLGNALLGASEENMLGRVMGTHSGFGLPAGLAGRMVPPIGIGLGLYGLGHAIFSNILSRGLEVRFPVNTPLEVRLDAAQ
jgi:hypothetical protein